MVPCCLVVFRSLTAANFPIFFGDLKPFVILSNPEQGEVRAESKGNEEK